MAAEAISPAKAYQKAREEQFELRSRRQNEKTARNTSKDKTHTATTLSGDTVTIRTPVLDETKKNSRISAVDDLWERDAAGQNKKNDTTANTGNGRVSVGAGRETTKEDTWLQKSAYFEDGYDFGDVTKTVIATARDFKDNMAAGLLGIGEQGLDTLAYFGPAASQMQFIQGGGYYNLHNQAAFDSTQKAAKKAVSDFVAKDLYDEEVLAKRAYENSLARKILPVDIENGSVFGERMDTLAQSTGQLAGKVALSPIVPWPVTTAVTSFGGEVENALRQGATYEQAGLSGVNTAVWDTLPERLSGGISFGSKALTDALTKRIAGSVPGKAGSALTKLGLDMIGEGAEGVVSQFGSNLGSALYRDAKLGEILFGEEARQGYRDSFVGDAILGGFGSAGKLLPGTADLDSRISDLKRQLEAVRYENDLAALMAEYDKHVPGVLQDKAGNGTINKYSDGAFGSEAQFNLKPRSLMDELANSGVKYNPSDVVMVTKTEDGTLLWLETGNPETGLIHIQNGHADNFAKRGVEDIPQALSVILKETPTQIITNSRGTYADYMMNGKSYRVTYGSNGYIVSFYPVRSK